MAKKTLTESIHELINELKIHHHKQSRYEWWLAASTIGLVVATLLLVGIEFHHSTTEKEIKKIEQTMTICNSFTTWNKSQINSNNPEGLKLRSWLYDTSRHFLISADSLLEDNSVRGLFGYFEDIKILGISDLLVPEISNNYFYYVMSRLNQVRNPTVKELIDRACEIRGSKKVFDGYTYCHTIWTKYKTY